MRTLIINGHPDPQSFCKALADAYEEGAHARRLDLHALHFTPNLQYGYRERTELEPDLRKAQEEIAWAEHLVFVYPTWWGFMPALLKGFIDRTFLPGWAFKHKGMGREELLKGRSARLVITTDTPRIYGKLVLGDAGLRVMRDSILKFCGIRPIKTTILAGVKRATPEKRRRWLEQVRRTAARDTAAGI